MTELQILISLSGKKAPFVFVAKHKKKLKSVQQLSYMPGLQLLTSLSSKKLPSIYVAKYQNKAY